MTISADVSFCGTFGVAWLAATAMAGFVFVGLFGLLLARQEPGRRMTAALLALAACFAVRFTFYALHMTPGA